MKKISLALGAMALASVGAVGIASATPKTAFAEESTTSIEASSEMTGESSEIASSESDETPSELLQKEISQKWDTYIAPLIGGISLTTIVSAIATIATTLSKSRKFSSSFSEIDEKVAYVKKLIDDNAELVEKASMACESIEEISEIVLKAVAEIKASGELSKGQIDEIVARLSEIEKLKPLIASIAKIEAMMAQSSDGAVRSGVAKSIAEIAKLAEDL